LSRKAGCEFGAASVETLHKRIQLGKLGRGLPHFGVLPIAIFLSAVDAGVEW
jgi:hypothetical protein